MCKSLDRNFEAHFRFETAHIGTAKLVRILTPNRVRYPNLLRGRVSLSLSVKSQERSTESLEVELCSHSGSNTGDSGSEMY